MKYLFLNHKLNFTLEEFQNYMEKFNKLYWDSLKVVVFPSFVNLPSFENSKSMLGAQNVSVYQEGSYTGEVSAKQLQSYQVQYCLVGHSERRNIFHESDEEIKQKINSLVEQGIIPVLCIGESQKENRDLVLQKQLSSVLCQDISNLVIAYEPVYSIGTGVVLENAEIESAIQFIKNYIQNNYHRDFPVLYGGSVNENNIAYLNRIPNLDGFLLGKASLNVDQVQSIMEEIE